MKKLFYITLIVILVSCLCACSITDLGDRDDKPSRKATTEATVDEQDDTEPATEPTAAEEANTITLNTYAITLNAGETYQLTATAATQDNLRWKSSNESVALVNSKGLVTAASAGVANITCYDGATEATCTVNVIGITYVPDNTPDYTGMFIFPHSSSAYLTTQEIQQKLSSMYGQPVASSFAQDAINEIYARNGYVFQSDNLAAYYNAQPWYAPNLAFTIANLNQYEKENVRLLQEFTN